MKRKLNSKLKIFFFRKRTMNFDKLPKKTMNDGTPIDPRNFLFTGRPTSEEELSLWNDPKWEKIEKDMTTTQKEHYKIIGEQMNGSIDYTSGESNKIPIPEPVQTSISYILCGLRSGLEPEDLDENEINTLESFIGKDWKEKLLSHDTDNNNTQRSDTAQDESNGKIPVVN